MADTSSTSPDLASAMGPLTLSYRPSAPTIPFDPGLMLSAVGNSSPSRVGNASDSIAAATEAEPSEGDKLRSQAAGL